MNVKIMKELGCSEQLGLLLLILYDTLSAFKEKKKHF